MVTTLLPISGLRLLYTAEDTAELSRYAKNYLPVLFNVYTDVTSTSATSDDSNSFILDCIQGYASIADQQVCYCGSV